MSGPSTVAAAVGICALAAAGPRPRRSPTTGRGLPARTARWARPGDLAPLVLSGREGPPPRGRLVLGRLGRRRVAAERSQSVAVFGPTQSGKTTGLAVPAILGWDGPVVAASVKRDLLDHTLAHRQRCGRVQVVDPAGTTGRAASIWTPLPAARTWPGARRAAAVLTEVGRAGDGSLADADFWYATAARLLAPLLFAAALCDASMADVLHWVESGEEGEVLDVLERSGVDQAVDAARSAFGKEPRQRSSVATTVETLLEPFAAAGTAGWAAAAGSAAEPVDAAGLLGASDTLYLCAPAHDQRRLAPLFVGVLRDVLDRAYDRVVRTGAPLDPPLLVVLDEAANLAPLADLDGLAATAAGHGVQLVTVWHDLAQLTARFGPRATTVVNNHRAKLFLSGIADPPTLEYASRLIGDEEVHLPATTSGGRAGPSTTRSPTVRPLAPPDRLRRIPPGSGVLVYRDLAPARLRLRPWTAEPWLVARAAPGGPVGPPGDGRATVSGARRWSSRPRRPRRGR